MSQIPSSRYPWMRIAALFVGGLAYGVSPVDLIPDLIPVLGLADDVALWATILAYALILRQKTKMAKRKEITAPVR
ncbi:MAG: DUF1232 domain-containing protein [Fimbriimonadaceae bacterium]|nr:DUF1232 domain-containing protein [Fimbriimonadaceae bacterium]